MNRRPLTPQSVTLPTIPRAGYHFDSMQSMEAVDLPLTCHPSPSLTTFVLRSSEVRFLFLDLDPYGGTDPLGMSPLFLKRTADVVAPLS